MDEIKNYKDALKVAKDMYDDLGFEDMIVRKRARVIAIQHMDGSYFEFHTACYKKLSEDFMAVFTEHHGFRVYHSEDVKYIKEWLRPQHLYYNVENE